jgi:ABC-type bacteriocin/lantibiotic exporter with double-glycine peptidase domain
MNFVTFLASKYFTKEKWTAIALFLVSLAYNVIQTNGMTKITSNIIQFAQTNKEVKVREFFYYFVYIIVFFIGLYWLFIHLQNMLLTKLRPWVRGQIVELLLKTNNQKFSEANFSKLNSPINRITDCSYFVTNSIVSYMFPNLAYLIITSAYFSYINPMYGTVFLIGNLLLIGYYSLVLPTIIKDNDNYEKSVIKTDIHLIDLLNNVDKIIYRGQSNHESNDFIKISNDSVKLGEYYYNMNNIHTIIMLAIIFIVVLISLWILIGLYFKKKIDITMFIASFTILLLYREKMTNVIEVLPDIVDSIGRTENVLIHFKHVNENFLKMETENKYSEKNMRFKRIQFHNVTYRYGTAATNVFENRNYMMNTEGNQIIGITGPSGNGKSTFIKLLLRMYQCSDGKITIDDVDINDIDPDYIRQEITYVNQNSKLFDRKVVDNMLYGCSNPDVCNYFLEHILKYPNITKLYRNTDIKNKQAGLLGENLSGGQRQIVNMIGGLVNPSKILVLDEPTNALDPELKKEVLNLIKDFSRYKQAIIIISHDKDVFPLFTQQLHM